MVFVYYTYSTSSWGDLLTNYDGTAITYDSIGNPTKWRNSSSLTWNGRTLTSQTLTNGNSITYKYNSDGIRTQKRVFDDVASAYITHDYVLDGTKILSETVTDNAYYNSYTLYYVYDANGSITGLHYNGAPYYFQKNIQGDVLRICNASGAVVVEYTYDAWGNILSVTGSMASTLGQYNPFRYRGYYYDSETDLYYLNSRYYDAEVGRFISADSYVSTGQGIIGFNMFAYCLNNPVHLIDHNGRIARKVKWGDFSFDGNTFSYEKDFSFAYGKVTICIEGNCLDIPDLATNVLCVSFDCCVVNLPIGEMEINYEGFDCTVTTESLTLFEYGNLDIYSKTKNFGIACGVNYSTDSLEFDISISAEANVWYVFKFLVDVCYDMFTNSKTAPIGLSEVGINGHFSKPPMCREKSVNYIGLY